MIAGISAAILFIVMFLGWFGAPDEINGVPTGVDFAEAAGVDTSLNAWQSFDFTDIVLLVTIVVAVGGAIATLMARDVGAPGGRERDHGRPRDSQPAVRAFRIINTPSSGDLDLDREFWRLPGPAAAAASPTAAGSGCRRRGPRSATRSTAPGRRHGAAATSAGLGAASAAAQPPPPSQPPSSSGPAV